MTANVLVFGDRVTLEAETTFLHVQQASCNSWVMESLQQLLYQTSTLVIVMSSPMMAADTGNIIYCPLQHNLSIYFLNLKHLAISQSNQ